MKFVLKSSVFFLLLLVMFSCGNDISLKQIRTFSSDEWERNDPLSFDFEIENTQVAYEILIDVQHTKAYMDDELLLGLGIAGPNGEKRNLDLNLTIRNRDGSFRAEKKGDVWSICIPIRHQYYFNVKGIYTFTLENLMSSAALEGISSVGVVIKNEEE